MHDQLIEHKTNFEKSLYFPMLCEQLQRFYWSLQAIKHDDTPDYEHLARLFAV